MILLIIIIISFITCLVYQMMKPSKYPPGPICLPFVGNLPELKRLSIKLGGQHLALQHLFQQYNTNILGLKLGSEHFVAVASYPLVKHVLISDEYEGRPDNFFIRLRCMGLRKGITCTDGEYWSIQRSFLMRHLRDLGFGKQPMEMMIRDEVEEIISAIEERKEDVNIGKLLAPGVINILWALVAGSRIPRNSEFFTKLLNILDRRAKAFDMSGGVLSQYPWLRFVIPDKSGYNLIRQMNDELREFLMNSVRMHHETWHEGRDDDIMYSFITEMKQANDDQLVMTCLDIFIAGSQTTSNTLSFAFLMMILNPEIQKKVQKTVDSVLDKDKPLEYSDHAKLTYIEAVILEIERYCTVTPIIGPRRVLKDTFLENYLIPKNTTVLISTYSVHRDREYWKDPDVFRPERFLNENGDLICRERILQFGLGRRRCLGEVLAKNCIFFFFTEILRNYTVILNPNSPKVTGIPLPGITLTPEYFKVDFIKR